jgi:hypothetical protein
LSPWMKDQTVRPTWNNWRQLKRYVARHTARILGGCAARTKNRGNRRSDHA